VYLIEEVSEFTVVRINHQNKPAFRRVAVLTVVFYLFFIANGHSLVWAAPDTHTVTTSVTVGNAAPAFVSGPAELTASTGANPTNVGTAVTFQAQAVDGNGDQYYLAICKGAGITPGNNTAPTCTAGSWCISSATNSNATASCSYTTVQGDAEVNAWYAYVCDKNSSSSCSAASQGSGDSGSPFFVNHPPVFDAISNNAVGGTNPGNTVVWSTSANTKDTDSNTAQDTLSFYVCKTASATAAGCTGETWCSSVGVASSAPTCSYAIPVPTADQTYNAYVYLFDSHGMAATGTVSQGTASNFTVNNVAPVVSAVTLNGGAAINLNEGTTAPVILTATVTDNNGCSDLTSVTASLYRSGIGYSNCDSAGESNDNNCYPVLTCSATTSCTSADSSATFQCTAYVQYHADPTDTATIYEAQNWVDTFAATDNNSASHTATVAVPVELNSLIAFSVNASIAYGSLSTGQTNNLSETSTTVVSTGNVGLDMELSGNDMCTDYPTCAGSKITVSNQKYTLNSTDSYEAATPLAVSATQLELNCQKTLVYNSPKEKPIYWGLRIPDGTPAGTYTGQNTLTAVLGETGDW